MSNMGSLAVKDEEVLSTVTVDAAAFAGVMMKYQDVGHAAKILGFEYNRAWEIFNSCEYALARDRLLMKMGDNPKEMFSKADAVEVLIEEARNTFDGSAVSRVSAVKQLSTILGYDSPLEHKLTGDIAPVITLSLVPPRLDEHVIEVEEVMGDDEVGDEVL